MNGDESRMEMREDRWRGTRRGRRKPGSENWGTQEAGGYSRRFHVGESGGIGVRDVSRGFLEMRCGMNAEDEVD